ncbi:MAG: hypothetical protein U0136_05445 [Bdellovibrionota bacterium]
MSGQSKILVLSLFLGALLLVAGMCLGNGYARIAKPLEQHYYGTELLFSGADPQGNEFSLHLLLSRAQDPLNGKFNHYYDIGVVYKNVNDFEYQSEFHSESAVVPFGALLEFQRSAAADLSAREGYELSVKLHDTTYRVEMPKLEADFLIKNSLEYTKYMSVGKASVTVDGATFPVDGTAEVSYSANFAPLVFFPGHDTLDSETHVITAWDDKHNFYFFDQSDVPHPLPAYEPHTWVLSKNHANGARFRAFAAETDFRGGQDGPVEWRVRVPDLKLILAVEESIRRNRKPGEGTLRGTVTEDGQPARPLHGVFYHHIYGKRS